MNTSACVSLFKLINSADSTYVDGCEVDAYNMTTQQFSTPTKVEVCMLDLANETVVYFADQPVDLGDDGTCMAWSFPNPDDDDEPSTATHFLFTTTRPFTPADL